VSPSRWGFREIYPLGICPAGDSEPLTDVIPQAAL
jgi:hypothetical protein